ncbi:MAG: HepT-like ribonuclease domain-containing protein [Planctomycetota bacterium]|jgi:uncharacterized protein with HEPN domain
MPRDDATVLDIELACGRIRRFTAGFSRESFLADEKTQSAIVHQLLIIGEAAKRLTTEFQDRHPMVPWRDIAGMRDRLTHHYDAVDLEELWKTTEADIPDLLAHLQPLLPNTDSEQ